jgi:hypothetical protein
MLSRYSNVILFCKDEQGNHYANEHKNKSIYEIYLMQRMIPIVNSDWVFKFGGRYHLHEAFRVEDYTRDKPVFKKVAGPLTYTGEPIVECIIYAIPKSYLGLYVKIYESIKNALLDSSGSTERLLYQYSTDCYNIESAGVIGRDAIEGLEKGV